MRITESQLRRLIREVFAATAQEEAEKMNAQVVSDEYGMSLVTDQAFWEEQGVSTGEELALAVLHQTYSDLYKTVHGVRPRGKKFDSVDNLSMTISDLDEYYREIVLQHEFDLQQQQEYERGRAELEAMMPTELERQYDPLPQRSGMGRRF